MAAVAQSTNSGLPDCGLSKHSNFSSQWSPKTRSRDGSLLPFKKGAFVAAIEMGYPIIPVVVKGTRRVMPKGGYLSIYPGDVEIVVKPPISTRGLDYQDRERLRDSVREIIAEEFSRPIAA